MLRKAFYYFAAACLVIGSASAQGQEGQLKSEVTVQGTGFFTKNSDGDGIRQKATETGGVLMGYRYNFNRWLAAEANYGYARNTQSFFGGVPARIEANVHETTGSLVVKLPNVAKLQPFVLAGGGALTFDPTGKAGGTFPGATWQSKGAFLYGGGADYRLTSHLALRAEYRGFVYKGPDFYVPSLNTDRWTHVAQPAAGLVFRF